MKLCARTSVIASLSGLLSLMVAMPPSWANTIGEPIASARSSDTDTLRQGLPGRRLGGGTRGNRIFSQNHGSLVALTTPDPLSITTAERPALLFYVPEMVSANTAEFVLRDRDDQLIYITTFEIDSIGGIIRIEPTSDELSALALNENYQWYFSLIPDGQDRASDIVVHGSIRRVEQTEWLSQQPVGTALAQQLTTATPLARAKLLYQQANLWHDAALILQPLRQSYPENTAIAAEWAQLLKFADLAAVVPVSQPLVQISRN
ncbi:MAG: DUF928 domain-containing protein [Phormidesmis sp. RL_2_1]|nr:DUF928 domain-containing protein [Phormidesmis sp. RL_2_1]